MTTNFSTEFPISHSHSVADVVNLAYEWILGSPHTQLERKAFGELPVDVEKIISEHPSEQVSVATVSGQGFDMGGVRYMRTEQGLEWITSIVSHKAKDRHLLSIQVSCQALNTAVRLPPPKKPYFIRLALTKLHSGMDGEIPVTDKPFRLSENEAQIASALIKGLANNTLPIIYVSAGFDGQPLIDPDILAQYVSGMAHVVVEPNRDFSYQLKTLTNSHNVFGGTVGVYWPDSNERTPYFIDDEMPSPRAIQLKIAKDIRLALANRRLRSNCTWAHLKESISRKRYELLKSEGSTELQEYIDAFDTESAAKDATLRDIDQENSRLRTEIQRLTAIRNAPESALIKLGNEQDFYPNEIRDIVISSLQNALNSARKNSRRQHILLDLLNANKISDNISKMQEDIKALFKTYREMDSSTRSGLLKLGFEISEEGKHHKIVFRHDGRYTFTISKTSSDHRAGKNIASDISNLLF